MQNATKGYDGFSELRTLAAQLSKVLANADEKTALRLAPPTSLVLDQTLDRLIRFTDSNLKRTKEAVERRGRSINEPIGVLDSETAYLVGQNHVAYQLRKYLDLIQKQL